MRLISRITSIAAALITALAVAPTLAIAEPTAVVETQKPYQNIGMPAMADSATVLDSASLIFPREFVDVTRTGMLTVPPSVPTLIDALSVVAPRPGRLFTDERQRRDRLIIERL